MYALWGTKFDLWSCSSICFINWKFIYIYSHVPILQRKDLYNQCLSPLKLWVRTVSLHYFLDYVAPIPRKIELIVYIKWYLFSEEIHGCSITIPTFWILKNKLEVTE
jgi:hypothetical protein